MAVGDRKDPYRVLQLPGRDRRHHARRLPGVLGPRLDARTPIEYREGDDGPTARKLPGLVKYSEHHRSSAASPTTPSSGTWRKRWSSGKVERTNGSIILLDDTGAEKVRWNFREAWPTKWTGPSFNATGNDVAIETLEIAHEGLVKA